MKFEQLSSGSDGNLYLVTNGDGKRILIECGMSWKKIVELLDYDLKNIVGCFVSHEHKDHSAGIYEVIEAGIEVFASRGTFEACGITEDTPFWRRANIIRDESVEQFKWDFRVTAFNTFHDAVEPLGFIIKSIKEDKAILFATDTSHIREEFTEPFYIVALECNCDVEVLNDRVNKKEINEELAKRICNTHFEKNNVKDYLREFCLLRNCEEIHLLHLSNINIDGEKTKEEFEKEFFISVKIFEKEVG